MVALSLGLLNVEKRGPDWFSGGFDRKLSLLTQLMLKRIKDSELEIGDFRMQALRNEKFSAPRRSNQHG